MRVADLRSYLQALIPPLEACSAKKEIIEDLHRASEGLTPFAEHSIKDFAGFLDRALEYARIGVIPVIAKPAAKRRAASPKVPALALDDASALVASLYDRATSDELTHEHIASELKRLDKLTAKDLSEVARRFELVPGKTKKATLDAILEKISRRKTTHARTMF
jgi:ParB-like chromosome segregation protein Spo0J